MGDLGSTPGLGRFLGDGNGYQLQDSGLENSMDSMGSQRVRYNRATFTSHMVQWVKNLPANAGDTRDASSTPGSGRSPGAGTSN